MIAIKNGFCDKCKENRSESVGESLGTEKLKKCGECKEGYYEDPKTLECVPCNVTCKTCIGSGPNKCKTCHPVEEVNREFDKLTN